MKLFNRFFVMIFSFLFFAVTSCKKDKPITDGSAKLNFSADSVLFDTVFSGIGSTTKLFKIYNKHKQSIVVSKAYIEKGNASPFRISIDGT